MKKTIKDIVLENKDRCMACGTPQELYQLAIELGFNSRAAFPRYKAALKDICDIDYDQVKQIRNEQRAESLAQSVTHETTLFVDAKARCQRFAICRESGDVVWFGIFFDDDQSFSYGDRNEQSACECAAARKAIWFASKIKEAVQAQALRLNLKVDAQWLCTLTGKAAILASDARRFNIELHLEWIPGTTNPADRWTTASGFRKWNDGPLGELATPVESKVEAPAETATA